MSKIQDLATRLDPGGTVPAAECPECGCLAYPISDYIKPLEAATEKNKVEMMLFFMGKAIYYTYEKADLNKSNKYIYSTDNSGSSKSAFAFDIRNEWNPTNLDVDLQLNHANILSVSIEKGSLSYPPEPSESDHIRQEHVIRIAIGHLEEDIEKLNEILPKFMGDKTIRNRLELCGFLMDKTKGMLELILSNSLD